MMSRREHGWKIDTGVLFNQTGRQAGWTALERRRWTDGKKKEKEKKGAGGGEGIFMGEAPGTGPAPRPAEVSPA